MSLKVAIRIMPRDVILDTQGRAVAQSLKSNGFQFSDCRVGKLIEMTFPDSQKASIKADVEKMLTQGGLYNPLIEKYEIEEPRSV